MNTKIIKTNGVEVEIKPKNGKDFSLKELQEIVGGLIDIVNLRNGNIIVINDDGKCLGLDINLKATKLALENNAIHFTDFIVGDVLLCKEKEVK